MKTISMEFERGDKVTSTAFGITGVVDAFTLGSGGAGYWIDYITDNGEVKSLWCKAEDVVAYRAKGAA